MSILGTHVLHIPEYICTYIHTYIRTGKAQKENTLDTYISGYPETIKKLWAASTQEAEAGGLQNDFQGSQGYREIPCLKQTKTKTLGCTHVWLQLSGTCKPIPAPESRGRGPEFFMS